MFQLFQACSGVIESNPARSASENGATDAVRIILLHPPAVCLQGIENIVLRSDSILKCARFCYALAHQHNPSRHHQNLLFRLADGADPRSLSASSARAANPRLIRDRHQHHLRHVASRPSQQPASPENYPGSRESSVFRNKHPNPRLHPPNKWSFWPDFIRSAGQLLRHCFSPRARRSPSAPEYPAPPSTRSHRWIQSRPE